jgi:hypothetical protein
MLDRLEHELSNTIKSDIHTTNYKKRYLKLLKNINEMLAKEEIELLEIYRANGGTFICDEWEDED